MQRGDRRGQGYGSLHAQKLQRDTEQNRERAISRGRDREEDRERSKTAWDEVYGSSRGGAAKATRSTSRGRTAFAVDTGTDPAPFYYNEDDELEEDAVHATTSQTVPNRGQESRRAARGDKYEDMTDSSPEAKVNRPQRSTHAQTQCTPAELRQLAEEQEELRQKKEEADARRREQEANAAFHEAKMERASRRALGELKDSIRVVQEVLSMADSEQTRLADEIIKTEATALLRVNELDGLKENITSLGKELEGVERELLSAAKKEQQQLQEVCRLCIASKNFNIYSVSTHCILCSFPCLFSTRAGICSH
jgi:hypothetical protein